MRGDGTWTAYDLEQEAKYCAHLIEVFGLIWLTMGLGAFLFVCVRIAGAGVI